MGGCTTSGLPEHIANDTGRHTHETLFNMVNWYAHVDGKGPAGSDEAKLKLYWRTLTLGCPLQPLGTKRETQRASTFGGPEGSY